MLNTGLVADGTDRNIENNVFSKILKCELINLKILKLCGLGVFLFNAVS